MTKKNKKKNKVTKKKTRDTCSVTQAPPVPTTLTSSTTLGETLTDKLESLFQSINLEVTSGAVQDYLCTKNDDLVFNIVPEILWTRMTTTHGALTIKAVFAITQTKKL